MPSPPSATWSDCWVASPGAAPAREFLTLAAALQAVPEIETILDSLRSSKSPSVPPSPCAQGDGTRGEGSLDPCSDLLALLDTAVVEDANGAAMIRPGFAPDLDDVGRGAGNAGVAGGAGGT